MKFLVTFIAVLVLVFVYRNLLSKRERKDVVKTARHFIVPTLVALAAVACAIFIALSPTLNFHLT